VPGVEDEGGGCGKEDVAVVWVEGYGCHCCGVCRGIGKEEGFGDGGEIKKEDRYLNFLKAFLKLNGSRRKVHLPGEIVAPTRLESLR
jgi:hypothetical protein